MSDNLSTNLHFSISPQLEAATPVASTSGASDADQQRPTQKLAPLFWEQIEQTIGREARENAGTAGENTPK